MKYAVISSSRVTEQMENFVKRQTQSVYGSKKVLLLSRIVAFFIPSYVYVWKPVDHTWQGHLQTRFWQVWRFLKQTCLNFVLSAT